MDGAAEGGSDMSSWISWTDRNLEINMEHGCL